MSHALSGNGALRMSSKTDIETEARRLAGDSRVTDYDFWRSLKNLNNEIFALSARKAPIPLEMIRWRAIIKQARLKRGWSV
ncbi:hypothetical protein [Oryzicola mucosus]|nr:hypothetical protein [Oryzicola mucosus]